MMTWADDDVAGEIEPEEGFGEAVLPELTPLTKAIPRAFATKASENKTAMPYINHRMPSAWQRREEQLYTSDLSKLAMTAGTIKMHVTRQVHPTRPLTDSLSCPHMAHHSSLIDPPPCRTSFPAAPSLPGLNPVAAPMTRGGRWTTSSTAR